MSHTIYHNLTITAPPQQVFDAISLPEHLINWWPMRCSGNPELGTKYNFYFTPEYDWYGEVVKVEENQSFHIKMTSADEDWTPTSFGFDLEEGSAGTKVEFFHTGWPACNDHFRRSSFCWALLLNGLKNYVERGVIIPFEDRE